ncbi:MAG: T9SS type A sorting domain-containing protein [Flavobacteriales bacterium]|nr:T9SS type A sorting domain-containing protein [Flavobacteriales bacterium]
MKLSTLVSHAVALSLGFAALGAHAQSNQIGQAINGSAGGVNSSYLTIYGTTGPGCGVLNYRYTMADPSAPWGGAIGTTANYYSLPAAKGPQSFNVAFGYSSANEAQPTYDVYVDGQYCSSCAATVNSHSVNGIPGVTDITIQDYITITHQMGDAWSEPNNGVREIGLRYKQGGQPVADIRFKVVFVGNVFTNVLGHYNTPALPQYILRDPPGDASYSSITLANGACVGETRAVTTGNSQNGYFKARIGVSFTLGFVMTVPVEIYGEVGADISATQTETENFENLTCLESSTTYSTNPVGPPSDLFMLTATRFAYGMAKIIDRPTCAVINKTNYMVTVPVENLGSYRATESDIKDVLMPEIQEMLDALDPVADSVAYKAAQTQLSVWQQTLDMNDAIKADATEGAAPENFFGAGAVIDHALTTTTTESYAINYEAALDAGLSYEFGVNIGGSGITAGGGAHFSNGYGVGQNQSNTVTNTVTYHMEDDDLGDRFRVKIKQDKVFGTYVFELDTLVSETSCGYEGGYQREQPSLSVGAPGNNYMVVNEVPFGEPVGFPLYICNNSTDEMTYYLKFRNETNTESGELEVLGDPLNSTGNGKDVTIPGGQCLSVTNLVLSEPDLPIGPDYSIELYLYSLCEPEISSSVTIAAHYGPGNFGSYCEPTSASGPAFGDYIDGVQIGSINNTGTGGVSGPTYTDHSAQQSTTLSRNAPTVLTITSGTNAGGSYAAWIDWDQDNTFEASETVGQLPNATPGSAVNLFFTVPDNAALGTTRMRVRGAHVLGNEPAILNACYNYSLGETEDYAVVINANTPQDCLGANNGPALPGTACNDNNASTGNDTWSANCQCIGTAEDCEGTPGGPVGPGSPCDDGNLNTANDAYNASCQCTGQLIDCEGLPGGGALPGTACDDGDATTGGDVYNFACTCFGFEIDCLGVIGGTTLPGTACNDGNPLTGGDMFTPNCLCAGTFATDCAGVEGGPAQPGTACDDNNPTTGNDTYDLGCVCAGQVYDCLSVPGGSAFPGTACDDQNPETSNDEWNGDCVCLGVAATDCAGVVGGTAQPGTACDDGDADTGNDTWSASCQCEGQLIDCEGMVGGPALPGLPCDDGNANTGNDLINANCNCVGQLIDCEGVAGGTNTIGTACNDGNAATSNDVYTANCICAGTLANDCEGVAGGAAQPGTSCNDGDATTGNDVYTANCTCAGQLIDCEGSIGGSALPGSPCDDGDPCTVNDVRGTDCACSGTTLSIGTVTGPTTVAGNTSSAFIVTPVANATSYTWDLPNGWTSGDNTAFALVATANNTAGPVQLCVTAMVGTCELTSCTTVVVDFNTGITINEAGSDDWFTVQPNPTSGIFQLRTPTTSGRPLRISVRNALGQEVLAPFTLAGQRAIDMDMSDVASGAYYLLATRDGERQVIKIMVQH